MNRFLVLVTALVALSLFTLDADAKRMGGGRSLGMQRQITPQPARPPQQATPSAPSPQQARPSAPPPQQPQPSGWRRWLGPIAGLAIGAGIASLFFHNGMGGALLGMLLIAALIMGVVMLVRLIRGARPQPLQYVSGTSYARSEPTLAPASSMSAAPQSVAATTQWPSDFDAQEFVRHAKLNFIKLQNAHDRKDTSALREFLTPDLMKEVEAEMREAADAPQKTDVVTLDADVLDVAAENGKYIVSVRFSGLIRETDDPQPQPFSEMWHLEKPVNGRSGWQVAGIQQA